MRPENPLIAARFLRHILVEHNNPQFLPPYDRVLLHIARLFSIILPHPVIFAARWRMRAVVAPFVGALETLRLQGSTLRNVNLLGEAVLGEEEATRRRDATIQLLSKQHIAYVSVKVSSVTSQLNIWDFDGSLERVVTALRPVFAKAAQTHPNVLVNLDMEEYRDLELTLVAFMRILEEPQFVHLDAGIVLQTYLPDALPALQRLVAWAHSRPGKGQIKIRLVKGANLAMERVDAILHGWQQAPFTKKSDTDSNYIRCLHWVLTEQRTRRVRIGVASHNLFLLAYAKKLAESRNVTHRVGFEMLQGMTPAHTPLLSKQGHGMLLYTPVCRIQDFDVAISYLFRRFEETSAAGNFLSSLHLLSDSSPAFMREEQRFRKAVAGRNSVSVGPRRRQLRPATAAKARYSDGKFINEPDTDGTLPGNRAWAMQVIQHERFTPVKNEWKVESVSCMDEILERGRDAVREWADGRGTKEREMVFKKIADNLARRRGELINALIHEGSKTFAEADSEVSEVIDFAIYYGHFGGQLRGDFEEFGVVVIAAPWNFPVAIAGGGVFAALAAGNCAILKPSSLTARCGEIVAECVWEAGVSDSVLQFVRVGDYDVGKRLIIGGDAVILTGSSETARMFKSWKCDMRLFAEVSVAYEGEDYMYYIYIYIVIYN